jgi:hypothetical protein
MSITIKQTSQMRPIVFLIIFYFSGPAMALHRVSEISPEPLGKVLSYPNCRITIFFEEPIVRMAGGVWLQKEKIDSATQVTICSTIEKVFAQMPQTFRSEFDKVDIYLVHTNKEFMYNWHQNRDVFLDAYRIRPGLSETESYVTSLLSELGFMIADKYSDTPDMAALIGQFRNYRQRYRTGLKIKEQDSMYDFGYVNRISFANNSALYDPQMEFGEIFAHMVCPETKGELTDFVTTQPNADLSAKVERMNKTIRGLFPELKNFPIGFLLDNDDQVKSGQSELLAAHELRSFQINMKDLTDNDIESPPPAESPEFASLQDEFFPTPDYQVDNNYNAHVFVVPENNRAERENNTTATSTVKKKKKGGWIWLGIIILALAMAGD